MLSIGVLFLIGLFGYIKTFSNEAMVVLMKAVIASLFVPPYKIGYK